MGERYACSQQSRTKRNTGINDARPNPTASRSHHRNGALTASYQNLAYQRYRSLSLNVSFGSMLSKKSVFGFESVAPVPEPATWFMMILGFAGIGYMTYRDKPKAAVLA
jgi:hypothetical protein